MAYWCLEHVWNKPDQLLLRVDTQGQRRSLRALADPVRVIDGAAPPSAPPLPVTSLEVDHPESSGTQGSRQVWDAANRAADALPGVEQLKLEGAVCGREVNADGARALLARLPRLRRIELGRVPWDVPSLQALGDSLDTCRCLEELALEAKHVSSSCVTLIAEVVQRVAARGVTIDLALETYARDRQVRADRKEPLAARAPFHALFDALAHADHLRRLDIAVPNMASVPVAALAAALGRATGLELADIQLADRPADAWAWTRGGEAADVAATAAAVSAGAAQYRALRFFRLHASPSVVSALFPMVVHILGHAPALEDVRLTELDEAVARDLADALSQCASLKLASLFFGVPAAPQTIAATLHAWMKDTLLRVDTPESSSTATVVTVARLLCSPSLPCLAELRVGGGRDATAADVTELADLVLHAPLLVDVQFESARGTDTTLMAACSATLKQHTAWSSKRRREMVLLTNDPDARVGKAAGTDAASASALPSSGLPLSELPYELLLHILAFVTPADLVLCRRVARAWRAAARELEDRDRPLWFACGRPDMPAFPDNCLPSGRSAPTPCSCGDVLVAPGDLELLWDGPRQCDNVALVHYGSRHMSRFPPARWAVLAPLRTAAVELARGCSTVNPHWLQFSSLCAGGRWAPAWMHVPLTAVRPTTLRGVRNLVEGLLEAPHGRDANMVDRQWQELTDRDAARRFYAKAWRSPYGQECDVLQTGAVPDAWRDAWRYIHASDRDSSTDNGSDSDGSDDDAWEMLVKAFEASWPQYKLATVGRRLHALCDDDGGWDLLAFAARRSAALWRYARVSGRTDAVREHLSYGRMREFETASDDELSAELDAVVLDIDALSVRIRNGLHLACAIRGLGRQAWWLGGLSPDGHLVGTLCLVVDE